MIDEALKILNDDERALRVIDALEEAGYEAWFVGGCVRDALMGRPINDIDITTSARWQEVARICEEAGMRAHETGTQHGTVTIVVDGDVEGEDPASFEVTTYRADSPTSSDARHPDSVEFVSTVEEDLARRDFTMNAMAWHPERGLLDPYGGLVDIGAAVIRAVGDPTKRFKEDALRILRACRFASQLGFAIDSETYASMLADKSFLTYVSTERVTHELDLFLLGDHVHDALMGTVDVLSVVLPELVAMKDCAQVTKYHVYDVLEHTAWAVQEAKPDRLVRWAAFCHDMGKPACAFFDADGIEHFYGHAKVSARIASGMLDRLLVSKQFKADIVALILNHSDHYPAEMRAVRRALVRMGGRVELYRALLDLNRADILAHALAYHDEARSVDAKEALLEEILADDAAFKVRDLAIDGTDIMALGVEAGPEVGRILEAALDAVIDELVLNEKDSLLEYVRTL